MRDCIRTAESVTCGHPDKVCDQISDSLVDAYLTLDANAKVALECMISQNALVIAGEVKSNAVVDVKAVAKVKLQEIGYDSFEKGFDAANCVILTNIHQQSGDINQGVERARDLIGAGDQGTMYGYATNETPDYIPVPLYYSHQLVKRLDEVRQNDAHTLLFPDGKAQVSVVYNADDQFQGIDTIVVSAQHSERLSEDELKKLILTEVISAVIPTKYLQEAKILVNPTGRFVEGGPAADTGLTGRKIMVDTYGGTIPHGGGAFSGKDPTKVDRSAAYMARYVAKNIVAAELADRCLVSVSYAIGAVQPVSVEIETYGTEKIPLTLLKKIVTKCFDFSPAHIISFLKLAQPIYSATAVYGHFRGDSGFTWESTASAQVLKQLMQEYSLLPH